MTAMDSAHSPVRSPGTSPASHGSRRSCRHHWLLDADSLGVCRLCGARKQFARPTEVGKLLDASSSHYSYPARESWLYRERLQAARQMIVGVDTYRG